MRFKMIILETVYQSCLNGLPICWTILFIDLFERFANPFKSIAHPFSNFIHPLIYSSVWTVYQSVWIIYTSVGMVSQIVKILCSWPLVIRAFFPFEWFSVSVHYFGLSRSQLRPYKKSSKLTVHHWLWGTSILHVSLRTATSVIRKNLGLRPC